MCDIIKRKYDLGTCDEILEVAWSTLWNVTGRIYNYSQLLISHTLLSQTLLSQTLISKTLIFQTTSYIKDYSWTYPYFTFHLLSFQTTDISKEIFWYQKIYFEVSVVWDEVQL